jgi:predicted NUDIX family NTP pyrophosphohydrolase
MSRSGLGGVEDDDRDLPIGHSGIVPKLWALGCVAIPSAGALVTLGHPRPRRERLAAGLDRHVRVGYVTIAVRGFPVFAPVVVRTGAVYRSDRERFEEFKRVTSRSSAGIVLFRRPETGLEVLLAHPGGPLFRTRDVGHWSIPKGEPAANELLLEAARREFAEETGHPVPNGPALPLGSIVQKGGKVVHGWAVEGDFDPARAQSLPFEIEWPPRSGRRQAFPEIDRVEWFDRDEARRRIKPAQVPLLDRLDEILGGVSGRPTP